MVESEREGNARVQSVAATASAERRMKSQAKICRLCKEAFGEEKCDTCEPRFVVIDDSGRAAIDGIETLRWQLHHMRRRQALSDLIAWLDRRVE